MGALRLGTLLALVHAAAAGLTLEFGSKKPRRAATVVETPVKPEEDKAPPSPPPPPFVSRGWLMKKGRKRRNWKRRYFVLSEDWSAISYYEDERCLKERGRVHLGGARCDLGLDYVPKRAHVFAFTLRARDDVYHLECSSEGERQRWLRTLKTASTSARDDARAEVEESMRQQRRVKTEDVSEELPAFLAAASMDELLGNAGLFHRHDWLKTLNNVLAEEATLEQMNKALRGIYVVEAMTLEYDGDDRIAVKRLELRPDNERHRMCLDLRWPQRLICTVQGYRPAGGGLPKVISAAAHLFKGIDRSIKHPLSFSLKSRLGGRPRCELLLQSSTTAPFPRLERMELTRLPRIALDKDALQLDANADQSLLKTVYGIIPKEVLVGMLERQLNETLEDPKTLKSCQWDLPDPDAVEEKPAGTLARMPPVVGKLARATETSWKGVAAEFPGATAQVQRSAGWFRREVGRRAVAARAGAQLALQAAAPGPRLRAEEDDEDVAPEWDPAKAMSILDFENYVKPDAEEDTAAPAADGEGWRPGPKEEE